MARTANSNGEGSRTTVVRQVDERVERERFAPEGAVIEEGRHADTEASFGSVIGAHEGGRGIAGRTQTPFNIGVVARKRWHGQAGSESERQHYHHELRAGNT